MVDRALGLALVVVVIEVVFDAAPVLDLGTGLEAVGVLCVLRPRNTLV